MNRTKAYAIERMQNIANRLNITPLSAWVILHRAMKKLRKYAKKLNLKLSDCV
jgi:hypothetical protein